MKNVSVIACAAIVALGVSCTGSPMSPTSPSAATGGTSAATSDGVALKITPPALFSPVEDERVTSRRPTFVWANAAGRNIGIGLAYEMELVNSAEQVLYTRVLGETPNTGEHVIELDLPFNTQLFWRIRGRLENEIGPWSVWGTFRTPLAPVTVTAPTPTPTPGGTTTGTVGPARSISFDEAYNIIVSIHNGGRFNLGGSSSRDYRINFIFGAVAAIHYGHPRWNPKGPDSNWCVKDAGGGRPPSDDVLVRCNTREAWDLISGAGGNGYNFHRDYLGTLPSIQNVYPPGRDSLRVLPN